jgi:hypothetical protein
VQLTKENLYDVSCIIYVIQTICTTIIGKSLYILCEKATFVSGLFVNITQHFVVVSSDGRYKDVD